jgi:hypothetical protein
MLAYVFWHRPRPDISIDEYESRLRAFHEDLQWTPPPGLRTSLTWQIDGAIWLPEGSGYEDWYLLEDSAALDVLNERAVSGPLGRVHDAIASLAAHGTAGLYQPRHPLKGQAKARTAVWFGKPAGMDYDTLYREIEALPGTANGELWRRMMTLGPTPEFCLLADDAPALPPAWEPITVERAAIYL